MRAATAIVGAIAFSSCLIALAFLLSGSDSSAPLSPSAGGPPQHDPVPTGELTQCSAAGGIQFSVEGVSCRVGRGVQQAFAGGLRGRLVGKDPQTGEPVVVNCSGTAPAICSGKGGVKVYLAPGD